MKLLFVNSHKFIKSGNNYYTTGQLPYELFERRYLHNFKSVTVCGRIIKKGDIENLSQSNGNNVAIKGLPNLSVIKKRRKAFYLTKNILKNEIKKADVIVARMPSAHANIAMNIAIRYNKTLVVEVVGDVFESLWNHGNILGKIIAPVTAMKYKQSIKKSKYTIYVTKEKLQKKYPSNQGSYTIHASNVEIDMSPKIVLDNKIKKEKERNNNNIKIGLIGSFATKYKGIHNGIDLIASLHEKSINAELHILGDGNNEWLIKRAQSLNVSKNIHFHGQLPPGKPVLNWLDKLDIYIQPSLTEGLPRALIEAMSRGLPAIASNVGGIPELLESEYLHKPNDSKDLTDKVLKLIRNKKEMLNQAEKNFEKSKEYSSDVLRKRREVFWRNILEKEQLK